MIDIGLKCYEHWNAFHSPNAMLEIVKSTIENNSFYYSKPNQKLLVRDFTGYLIDQIKRILK
jgi:hypothetical protein